MKSLMKLSLLSLAFLLLGTLSAEAQSRSTKKKKKPVKKETKMSKTDQYFDESGGFKHRLWYGGNFNLGYGANDQYSNFTIGVTPMVGYKIIGEWSVGPRIGVDYTYFKGFDQTGGVSSVNLVDYRAALFSRYKFKSIFAHVEYEYANQAFPAIDPQTGQYTKIRQGVWSPYYGLGYTAGDLIGYEILVLYNQNKVNNNSPTLSLPFDIRIGFNYKF